MRPYPVVNGAGASSVGCFVRSWREGYKRGREESEGWSEDAAREYIAACEDAEPFGTRSLSAGRDDYDRGFMAAIHARAEGR